MSTVMCLGDGSQGAVGSPVGLGLHAYEPTPVATLPSDIVSVHAGHYHSLALTSHGHLWAWGRNNEAQLGRGPSSRSRLDGGMLSLVLRMASCLDGVILRTVG
ncbi:hypothetical protein V8G54_017380 [Vigna mungo]|uniref:Uncharacterized protein n=1 Tax=Vigna mungo TaxID=3915 RepID=A0AAQ3NPQ7_VIGMU